MRVLLLCVFFSLWVLVGCGPVEEKSGEATPISGDADPAATASGVAATLTEAGIADAVWSSLKPNTFSQDRANWVAAEIRLVRGQEVAEEFAGEPAPGCWKGPTPVPNSTIQPDETYWFVRMVPRRATPVPQGRTLSPTEPPAVPEPFLYQALFLLEPDSRRVVARKLFCVIY